MEWYGAIECVSQSITVSCVVALFIDILSSVCDVLVILKLLTTFRKIVAIKPISIMTRLTGNIILCLCISFTTWKTVDSINCYQCSGTDSNNPFQCNEYLDSDVDLVPTDCGTIHDAQYCIKHVGRFEGFAIDCYQCNSSSTMECGDGLMNLDGGILKPFSCGHVYEAQYCIKRAGGIGTERYCSSRDLGNYCNYVRQPGDKLEYRTCIFTCSTDGCNGASCWRVSGLVLILACIAKYVL